MESKDTSRDPNRSEETSWPLVVGLFPRGEDAQLAITDLCNTGFRARQIGAAFRSTIRNVDPGGLSNSSAAASLTLGPSPLDSECSDIENWTYDCDYAQGDFEEYLAELGLPQERARVLKLSLAPGGAIVMVRTIDSARVEDILERHNGRLQHETRPRRELSRTPLEGGAPIAGTIAINPTSEPAGSHPVLEYPSGNSAEQTLKQESRRRTNDRIQLLGEMLQVQKERTNRGELRAGIIHRDAGNVSLAASEPKNDATLRRPA